METLQRTANRGSVATGTYSISNSVKLEDTNTEYLQRAASGSDGNRRTMTLSMWLKRTQPGNDHIFYSQGSHVRFRWKTSDYFSLRLANGHEFENESRLFRDPSAWYHMVVAIDTTQSTDTNRVKIYWNGVQETTFNTAQYPDQNEELTLGQFSSVTTQLGWFVESGYGFDGYITEVNYIDGLQKAPTDFGEFDSNSGIWIPKQYTGSYGSEGFFLNFDNASSMGADSSGNGNNFNLNNVAAADQATDTPTNNFCTLNVLDQRTDTPALTTEGATVNVQDPGSGTGSVRGTMGASSGKWYWEIELDAFEGSSLYYLHGISSLDVTAEDGKYPGSSEDGGYSVGIYGQNGNVYYNGSNATFETSGPGADGDLIGVFLDLDNGTLRFAKNGTLIGNVSGTDAIARSGASLTGKNFWTASVADGTNSTAYRTLFKMNFGGYTTISISSAQSDPNGYGKFEYSPNDGTYDYYALCSKNLAQFG